MAFSLKKNIISKLLNREVDGAEVWIVSWDARYGSYMDDLKRVAKAFLRHEDAVEFADSLKAAKDLLQYTEDIKIRIEKQK